MMFSETKESEIINIQTDRPHQKKKSKKRKKRSKFLNHFQNLETNISKIGKIDNKENIHNTSNHSNLNKFQKFQNPHSKDTGYILDHQISKKFLNSPPSDPTEVYQSMPNADPLQSSVIPRYPSKI